MNVLPLPNGPLVQVAALVIAPEAVPGRGELYQRAG
jgi:hypothetical protein